jgi:hypothetical protein
MGLLGGPRKTAGKNGPRGMGEPMRVQKARIIVPVTRATIVLIEVDCCARALWTRPKPTTSVTQANASITTLSAASSEKLFMTCSPKTSLSLVGARWRKVHGYPRPIFRRHLHRSWRLRLRSRPSPGSSFSPTNDLYGTAGPSPRTPSVPHRPTGFCFVAV